MKVKVIATGNTAEYNDSYAARLIEQGEAVPAPPEEKKASSTVKEKTAKKG